MRRRMYVGLGATRMTPTLGTRTRRLRSRMAVGAAVTALSAFFSLGIAAPAATAVSSDEDASYELTIDGHTTSFADGETVVYGMEAIYPPGQVSATLELVFSGSVPTSKLHGHRYSGTLSGTAFFMGAAVAKTVPNNTLYTYP